MREACFFRWPQKTRDGQPLAARDQEQPLDAEFFVDDALEPDPKRVERPFAHAAAMADFAHGELRSRDRDFLVGARRAEVGAKSPVHQQDIEPAESEHRPSAAQQERHPRDEAQGPDAEHEDEKAARRQRTMRGDDGRKNLGFGEGSIAIVVVGLHGGQYRGNMARKTIAKTIPKTVKKRIKKRVHVARKGQAARLKPAKARAKADAKAVNGALPQWTKAEIEEAFRRFAAANPNPNTELEHGDPFTLLVSVVLSAQATDAGVNRATPALFALADTPEKMIKLGEPKVRDLIKTIGLFRTKAKNVIALSRKLVEEHGGKVPHDRAALEALPGVGRKTANVVLNVAFGEPTIAVDTHIFRVGNRTGLAVGKTPLDVEMKLMEVVPEKYLMHAHHWLILHGRYTCVARRPLCEKCIIADLCKWPGKTVNVPAGGAAVR
jgi:endonuclease-3